MKIHRANGAPLRFRWNSKGFTIIEVIIVLAVIGGLMVVILSVASQSQKGSRDSQRRAYAGQVAIAMQEYYKNNRKFPSINNNSGEFDKFLRNYLPEGKDSSTGKDYRSTPIVDFGNGRASSTRAVVVYRYNLPHVTMPERGQVYIAMGHVCYHSHPDSNGGPVLSDATTDSSNPHLASIYAIVAYQERGGFYCVDNYSPI